LAQRFGTCSAAIMSDKTAEQADPEAGHGEQKGPRFIYAAFSAAAWIILVHELLERFSFYGMKGILTYYLNDYIGFDDDTTTILYHLFTGLSYLTPILGTFLADNFWGQYKTIAILGIVYLIGHLLMPLTALTKNVPGPLISMLILAIGTGGIKPCVAAFGGDQVGKENEEVLDGFFAMFYMCINIGAFASQLITPILREQVKCVDDSCYPLGFGVPAIAFGLCYVLFLAGTRTYKIYPKPTSPMLNKAMKVIFSGKLWRRKEEAFDESKATEEEKADRAFIEDVRVAVQVLLLFLPFPIYWALFDQQGSRWVLQGKRMDGYISESFSLTADQMQSVNPLLIVMVVPIFNNIVYPLFAKCNLLKSATSRIFWGYLICASAFGLTGIIELLVDNTVPVGLPSGQAQLRIFNANPCPIDVAHPDEARRIPARSLDRFNNAPWIVHLRNHSGGDYRPVLNVTRHCGSSPPGSVQTVWLHLRPGSDNLVIVADAGRVSAALPIPASVSQTRLRLVHADHRLSGSPVQFGTEPGRCLPHSNLTSSGEGTVNPLFATDYCEIASRLDVPMYIGDEHKYSVPLSSLPSAIKYATIYAEFNASSSAVTYHTIVDRELNPLHITLQLPQYLLMCISEVLFSVTALAYAYSEAPANLKSLLQTFYLVSIFFGNMIVIAVAAAPKLPKQAHEFFLFAGLVFLGGFVQLFVIFYYNKIKVKSSRNQVVPVEIPMDSVADKKLPEYSEESSSGTASSADVAKDNTDVAGGNDGAAKATGDVPKSDGDGEGSNPAEQ
ncbi:hypothetical protein BOX15_Mlig029362g1, partial [Macrostomum lignano]